MTEFLPCPFCGGSANFERMGNPRQSCIVVCDDCGCRLETNESWTNSGMHWNSRVPVQPKYLTGCLLDGVCRGMCEFVECPNHGMVVAARVCVEPKEDGVVYPGGERS